MKKTLLLISILMLSVTVKAATKEDLCLTIGSYAKSVAEARQAGVPEEKMIKNISNDGIREAATSVIRFVFTMQMEPDDARRTVYLKCLTDGMGLPNNVK